MNRKRVDWRYLFGLMLVFFLLSCAGAPEGPAPKERKTCLDCHPKYHALVRKDGPVVHAPVEEGNCAGCHRPHGLIGGAFLKRKQPYLCLGCHKKMMPQLRAKVVHGPVKKGKCDDCHLPHSAPQKNLLKAPTTQLCLKCHPAIGKFAVNRHEGGVSPMPSAPRHCLQRNLEGEGLGSLPLLSRRRGQAQAGPLRLRGKRGLRPVSQSARRQGQTSDAAFDSPTGNEGGMPGLPPGEGD